MDEKLLKEVDKSELSIDNFQDVWEEVVSLASNWRNMCTALGLPASEESEIATTNANEQGNCMREVLRRWLTKTYDTKKYGTPTWQNLVKKVANPAGGRNAALAEKIAKKHSKKTATKRPKPESSSTASPAPKRVKSEPEPKPKESLGSSSKKKSLPQQSSKNPKSGSSGEKSKLQPPKSTTTGKPAAAKTKTVRAPSSKVEPVKKK